jgi:putative ABC transport system permease protein
MVMLQLILRLALRNRGRTLITAMGVGVTLMAFLLLRTLISNWYGTSEQVSTSDQLIVRHKISIAFDLYRRMAERIRTIPGVEEASALVWFSGYYKDEKTRFGQLAVEGDSYFDIYPEYAPPPDQLEAFMGDLSGAVIGSALVEKHGWKIGDKVTLTGTIFPGSWDFTVRGIYPGKDGYNKDWLFMHYKRLELRDEAAHRLVVKAPPSTAAKIDELFANTDTPTKTESEMAVRRSWASWSTAVVAAINAGSVVILGILMLVLGNAMAMATRDGMREYASMRAIGFRSRFIMVIVLGEGLVVTALGTLLGLLTIPAVLTAFSKLMEERLGGSWQLSMGWAGTLGAVLAALLGGVLASALPAWRAGRVPIVQALRKVA